MVQDGGAKVEFKTHGFLVIPDEIVHLFGPIGGAVWGYIYQWSRNGQCYAQHETIAKRIGVSRKTVWIKIQEMLHEGYITEIPDNTKKTKTYVVSNKIELDAVLDGAPGRRFEIHLNNWIMAYFDLMTKKQYTMTDVMVYGILCRYGHKPKYGHPTAKMITHHLGISKAATYYSINRLIEAGLVKCLEADMFCPSHYSIECDIVQDEN